jgi:hypothetical protein
MKILFWTNTVWYIALAIISIAMISISVIKASDRKKALSFFFAVLGMTYFIEVFLMLVTNAYIYYPKIASDSFHESLIGNFFSQYSVSASAVLIAVFGLKIRWQIAFSIAYFLIDVLFVRLGIYAHNWYRSWYTLAGFFIYSRIVIKWHKKVFAKPSKFTYFSTLFLSTFAIGGNAIGTTLNFLEIRRFSLGLFDQPTRDNTAVSILYDCIMIAAVMIPLYRLKSHPVLKCLIFFIIFVIEYILYRMGVIIVKPGWFAASSMIAVFGFYAITGMVDRSLGTVYKFSR